MTHNLTQPSTSSTQQESVKKVPTSLVTTKPANQGIPPPPPPPPRGMTPPIKRVLPAKSTEQMTEVLKESYVGTRTCITSDEEIQEVSTETEH